MLSVISDKNNDNSNGVAATDTGNNSNNTSGMNTTSNQQHILSPPTPPITTTGKRPRGMSQYLKLSIDPTRAPLLQAGADARLFDRLQEENALLSPQDSTTFILAQIERQNILLQENSVEKDGCCQLKKNNGNQDLGAAVVGNIPANDNTQPSSATVPTALSNRSLTPIQHGIQQHNEETIDWDFWEAVIHDFDRLALEMPHLLSVKLRAGVPAPQRGLIWQAMCKSGSLHLETVYGQLCKEHSPCERIIQRDLARTFPYIDMFKQENGAGQAAMRRILEAYSLYDTDVGYCQGLAFLVGPLLMHMPEVQAFCVFVRLMETYEMRPMFTLNMEGLQLRLYQFNCLLKELAPDLADHMEAHGVHAAMYASQWFLTLFAYGFPLTLVERIYDIVFAEGAAETIMRIAIAMLRRSEQKILQETEFEDLLDHVTSYKLCEAYENDAAIIHDATALSSRITREKMDTLAREYEDNIQSIECANSTTHSSDAFPGKFGFFWKRKKPSPSVKSQQQPLKRANSTSSNNAKKRWSSFTTSAVPSHNQPQQQQQQQEANGRASFSSVRSYSSSFLMVDAQPTHSSKYITIDQHEQEVQRLNWSLAQLSTKYQQVLDELAELKIDKKDAESERDALMITMKELEKCVDAGGKKTTTVLYGENDEDSLVDDESSSFHSGDGSPDGFSDTTSQSMATTMVMHTEHHDGGEALRAELVRIKVENFELQQQSERLTQDLEDVQSKLDMVNDGQLALVEKMILTKADMDELMEEKKAKDLEWVEVTHENKRLKEELTRVRNQRMSLVGAQKHQDIFSRICELERSLADAKLRLAEQEAADGFHQQQWSPTPPHHAPSPDIKRRATVDMSSNVEIKMRPASMDVGPMTRSPSIYGRVWHALAPRAAGAADVAATIKGDHV